MKKYNFRKKLGGFHNQSLATFEKKFFLKDAIKRYLEGVSETTWMGRPRSPRTIPEEQTYHEKFKQCNKYGIKNRFICIISIVFNNKSNLCINEKYCLIIRSKMLTPMFDSLSVVKRVASVLLSSPANSCTMLVVLHLVVAWAMSWNWFKCLETITWLYCFRQWCIPISIQFLSYLHDNHFRFCRIFS